MDSEQFVFTVINDTLDRELDRKRNLEKKVESLVRFWTILITIFVTIMTFLVSHQLDVIIDSIPSNNNYIIFILAAIAIMSAVTISYLLYLITVMVNTTLAITYKNEIEFNQEDVKPLMESDPRSLKLLVCESLNETIKDYRNGNNEIKTSIEKTIPKVSIGLVVLILIPVFFTLIVI